MEHGFLDKYATIKSPVHSIDVRIKTASIFAFIFLTALIPNGSWIALLISFSFSFLVYLLSRVPIVLLIKRISLALPFVLSISIVYAYSFRDQMLINFSFVMLKAITCVIFMVILVSTSEFNSILKTMRTFKIPESLTSILSFFYRYVFVIYDELERMGRARALRSSGAPRHRLLRISFALTSNLMLRSYEKSERIYYAMKARGYTGKLPFVFQKGLRLRDYFSALISILLIITLLYSGWIR